MNRTLSYDDGWNQGIMEELILDAREIPSVPRRRLRVTRDRMEHYREHLKRAQRQQDHA